MLVAFSCSEAIEDTIVYAGPLARLGVEVYREQHV